MKRACASIVMLMLRRGSLQPVTTVLKRNSNGYPIIVSNGVEYSQCR
jgi:hypothetical protein